MLLGTGFNPPPLPPVVVVDSHSIAATRYNAVSLSITDCHARRSHDSDDVRLFFWVT